MTEETRPRGRPSLYTPELAAELCDRLSKGEPLAQICRDDHMPATRTIEDWKRAHPEFFTEFGYAREAGFDAIALDTLRISDDSRDDVMLVGREGEEREVCNTEFVQRSKLRVETRLKLLAKWDPRRYGDKVQVEASGPGGGAIQHQVNGSIDLTMTPQQAAEAYADSLRGDDDKS